MCCYLTRLLLTSIYSSHCRIIPYKSLSHYLTSLHQPRIPKRRLHVLPLLHQDRQQRGPKSGAQQVQVPEGSCLVRSQKRNWSDFGKWRNSLSARWHQGGRRGTAPYHTVAYPVCVNCNTTLRVLYSTDYLTPIYCRCERWRGSMPNWALTPTRPCMGLPMCCMRMRIWRSTSCWWPTSSSSLQIWGRGRSTWLWLSRWKPIREGWVSRRE